MIDNVDNISIFYGEMVMFYFLWTLFGGFVWIIGISVAGYLL